MKIINKSMLVFIILITITIFTSCQNNKREELNVLTDITLQPVLNEIEKVYEKSNKNIDLKITFGNYEELKNTMLNNKNEFLVLSDKRRLRYYMDEINCSYERAMLDFAREVDYKITENDAKIATIYSVGIIDTNYEVSTRGNFVNRDKLESPNYENNIANMNMFMEYLTSEECQKIYSKYNLTLKEKVNILKGEIIDGVLSNEDSSLEVYLNVYLPPNYSEDAKPYKVIYFQDGYSYQEFKSTYDRMISENEIEPFIGVFIHLRKAKYGRDQSLSNNSQFTNFIGNDVVKYVRENYNVSEKAEDNIAAGYSLGAFQSFVLVYKFPNVFKGLISQSIGLGIDSATHYIMNDKNDVSGKKFYIENGQFNDTMRSMKMTVIEVEKKGIEHVVSYFVGNHSIYYWRNTIEKALVYLLGDKDFVR